LKIAVPQRGAWDTSITEIGNRAGIFKKHGVNAELLFTGGGAEALGAIIGGSIDAAVSVGISTVLGSFSKGAPVRVFSAETTGQPDIYWFVPRSRPSQRRRLQGQDHRLFGQRVVEPRRAAGLAAQEKITAKPTSTGGVTPSFTSGMTGQVDVAWSTIPIGLKEADEGRFASWPALPTSSACATARAREHHQRRDDGVAQGRARPLHGGLPGDDRLHVCVTGRGGVLSPRSPAFRSTWRRRYPDSCPRARSRPIRSSGWTPSWRKRSRTKFMSAPLTKEQIAELVRMPVRAEIIPLAPRTIAPARSAWRGRRTSIRDSVYLATCTLVSC
jgi:NitT/TauT family transport system substrate-binding protein